MLSTSLAEISKPHGTMGPVNSPRVQHARCSRRLGLALMLLLTTAAVGRPSAAQTLARRGWAGSGLNFAPWWHDAVFIQLPPKLLTDNDPAQAIDPEMLGARLDSLRSLGGDALLLTPLALQSTADATSANTEIKAQREDTFDLLLAEAGRRHLRILVDLPLGAQSASATTALARFWLSRGVAGFRLTLAPSSTTQESAADASTILSLVQALRSVCATYNGDRVLIWDAAPSFRELAGEAQEPEQQQGTGTKLRTTAGARRARQSHRSVANVQGPELQVNDMLDRMHAPSANDLRAALFAADLSSSHPFTQPVLSLHLPAAAPGTEHASAALLAATLFTTPAPPLLILDHSIAVPSAPPSRNLEAAQPSGEDKQTGVSNDRKTSARTSSSNEATLNLLRQLSSLRHANRSIGSGAFILLPESQPDVVAWVRVARSGVASHPVLVLCNFSDQPHVVSLDASLRAKQINVPASSWIRPLASDRSSTDPPVSSIQSTASVVLEPYAFFIGELHTTTAAPHPSSRHRHRATRRHHARP